MESVLIYSVGLTVWVINSSFFDLELCAQETPTDY